MYSFDKTRRSNDSPAHRAMLWVLAALSSVVPSVVLGDSDVRDDQGFSGASAAAMVLAAQPGTGVVGEISITNSNIFDLSDPAEDTALYRFANRVHIRTRTEVIQKQLLLQTGDAQRAKKLFACSPSLWQHLHAARLWPA